VRKGEFLAAQYQRAVALESEALQLAAAQRYLWCFLDKTPPPAAGCCQFKLACGDVYIKFACESLGRNQMG
jgi:hypothetical protein